MIELIETDALVAELLSRFQHAVFIGAKVRPNQTNEQPNDCDICDIFELKEFKGEHRTCQGLAYAMLAHIERVRLSITNEAEGDW